MIRLLPLLLLVDVSSIQVAAATGSCTKKEVTQSTGEKKCVSYRSHYDNWQGRFVQECSSYEDVITTLYTYIFCKDLHLTEHEKLDLATNQESNCKYIVFEDSDIPTVHAGTFASYTEIKELYLNSSKVRNLELAAFGGMSKLEILHLEDNDINEIVRGTLNSLTNLKKLDISKNNLSEIEDNSFQGLLALEELSLTRNNLRNLTAFTLGSLGSLKYIDLSFNSFSRMNEKAFSNTHNLEKLLLNNNYLEDIPWSVVQNLTKLKIFDFFSNKIKEIDFKFFPDSLDEVNVSHNNISSVRNWPKLNNIKTVNLTNNNISEISAIGQNIIYLYLDNNNLSSLNSLLFNHSSGSLKEILLFNNGIKLIDVDSFMGLTKLEKLDLHDNQIEQLPIGCFTDLNSLKSLDLSHNILIELEFGTFTGLSNLEQLDLSYNKLIGIHENSFHVFTNLKLLYIHNNNIKSIMNYHLLSHLKNLQFVSLKSNNWTCNALLDIIKRFRDRKVNIPEGDNFKVSNVQGIPCLNEKPLIKEKSKVLPEDVKVMLVNNSETLKHLTTDTFCDTNFYEFLDQDFKNSTFYTFFNKDFLGYIEKDLNKSKLYQFSDQYSYNNKCDCHYNYNNNTLESSVILKYFNQDFYTSGFFKFFNEGYKNTQFYKELIAIEQMKVTTRVDVLQDSNAIPLTDSENLENYLRTFGDKILILQLTLVVAIILIIIMFMYLLYQLRLVALKNEQNKKITEASLELL